MSAAADAETNDGLTRRGLMRRGGTIAAGAAATVGVGSRAVPRFSPVGRAQAIAPIVVVGGVAAASAAFGWVIRNEEVLGSDAPPEGMTADGLHETVFQTVQARESNNASTFVDNQNIVNMGFPEAMYGEGKVSGIEALNEQLTQSEVETAATDAADAHATTVMKNFFKSWNESVNELGAQISTVNDHPDQDVPSVFLNGDAEFSWQDLNVRKNNNTVDLPDGSTFDLHQVENMFHSNTSGTDYPAVWDPTMKDCGIAVNRWDTGVIHPGSGDNIHYLLYDEWNSLYNELDTIHGNVRDGLLTWVDTVYSDVQSGELDTADLLTPKELAQMSAEDGVSQAIADLMALNVPVDLEREATITIDRTDETITVEGMLSPTSDPGDGMPAGNTYDPASLSYDVYFTYDITQGSGTWESYETAVDGGIVTFTREPYESITYTVNTAAGESVDVPAGDFTLDDSGTEDVWTVDLSDDLETAITEVDSVEMKSSESEEQVETIRLQEPFTIEKYTDSDGNEHDTADFSQEEPQSDNNYITQEEWDDLKARNEELIEKYEESKEQTGGSTGGNNGDGLSQSVIVGLGALVAAGLAAVGLAGNS